MELDQLVERYADLVYQLALTRTRSPADADDITQEVFLRAFRHVHELTDEAHARAWLIRVTVNCTKNLFLSAWRRRTVPLEEAAPLSFSDPEYSRVWEAVLALPLPYRTAVHLHYYQGLSVEEIAQTTGAAVGTVKSQLFRGREKLRQALKGDYDGF